MKSCLQILVLAVVVPAFAPHLWASPAPLRPALTFSTKTARPMLVGVPELVPAGVTPPKEPRYFRRMTFGGERHAAVGEVLGKPGECPGVFGSAGIKPWQLRQQLRGEIVHGYDADLDDQVIQNGARVHLARREEAPWPAESCSPPPSPFPLTFPVSEEGTLFAYAGGLPSSNNPLGLPVASPTEAADTGVAGFVAIGDGFRYYPAYSWDTFRLRLDLEDSPSEAEARARRSVVVGERDVPSQTSIRGSSALGRRWMIRTVEVQERIQACPGDYLVTRVFEWRALAAGGDAPFVPYRTERVMAALSASEHLSSYSLPLVLGYEVRLSSVTYVPVECLGCDFDEPPGGVVGPDAGAQLGRGKSRGPAGMISGPRSDSIDWQIPLGPKANGRPSGVLAFSFPEFTPRLYGPGAFDAFVDEEAVEVIRSADGAMRQVLSPHELVDFVVLSLDSYEIRFHLRAQVGPKTASGLYPLSGDPYVVWRVENPAPGSVGRWRVIRRVGSESIVTEVDESQPGRRVFSEAGGLKVTETQTVKSAGERRETIRVRDASGAVCSSTVRAFRAFPWGEEQVEEVLDPDGAALTTRWEFDAGANSRNAGRPVRIRRPDGYVEEIAYDPAGGLELRRTAPVWKGSTSVRLQAQQRVDVDGDGVPELVTTRRWLIEPGTGLSLSFTIDWTDGRRQERRAIDPKADWNTPSNLVVEESRFASGWLRGEVSRRVNPEGTSVERTQEGTADGGSVLTEVFRGAGTLGSQQGRRVVTRLSARGVSIDQRSWDLASGLMLQSTRVLESDEHGRPVRVLRADGAEELRTYCTTCGALESVAVRGVTRRFKYDALGRKIEEWVSVGSQVLENRRFEFDAEGRLRREMRVDPASGAASVTEEHRYDLAGREIETMRRGGGTARHGYSVGAGGSTVVTSTFADGGTAIETWGPGRELISLRGTAVAPWQEEWQGRDGGGGFVKSTQRPLDDGSVLLERRYFDLLGRLEAIEAADGTAHRFHYDGAGRLVRQVDPDGVAELVAHDDLGRPSVFALDVDRNQRIDFGGSDRIRRLTSLVAQRDAVTVERTSTEVWASPGSTEPAVTAVEEVSVDGLRRWSTSHGLTTYRETSFPAPGWRRVATTRPDGSLETREYFADRLTSVVRSHPQLGDVDRMSIEYDALGRRIAESDQNGTVRYRYDAEDRVEVRTGADPDPQRSGEGFDPAITRYGYDAVGRLATVTHPDGGVSSTRYAPTGAVLMRSGARTYPSGYDYDQQGRLRSMTTWQDFARGAGRAVTAWSYEPLRGRLAGKRYADGTGPTVTYSAAGRLLSRTWARGVTARFRYDEAGDLVEIQYSDDTPGVRFSYDRLGRRVGRVDGAGTSTIRYLGLTPTVAGETDGRGTGHGREYDSLQRMVRRVLLLEGSPDGAVDYAWDPISRLKAVTRGGVVAGYSYRSPGSTPTGIEFASSGAMRLALAQEFDAVGRVAIASSRAGAAGAAQRLMRYAYDGFDQRVRARSEDQAGWDYAYDERGQLVRAVRRMPDGSPVAGLDQQWSYDDIGNRRSETTDGVESIYGTNLLNQYTSRTVAGQVEVSGVADEAAVVTVQAAPAWPEPMPVVRQGSRFHRRLAVDNGPGAVRQRVEVTGVRNAAGATGLDAVARDVRWAYVPQTPERFTYDADGNLTSDAWWSYRWDGENRLVRMETSPVRMGLGEARQVIVFSYDGIGRQVSRTVTTYALAGTGPVTYERFPDASFPDVMESATRSSGIDGTWFSANGTRETAAGRLRTVLHVPRAGEWRLTWAGSGFSAFRMKVDGEVWLDRFSGDGPWAAARSLTAGPHEVTVDFLNLGRWVDIRLLWAAPGGSDVAVPTVQQSVEAPVVTRTTYVHDGWLRLADREGDGRLSRTYVWGVDLGGGLGTAAGVGGLLMEEDRAVGGRTRLIGSGPTGNVEVSVDAADGTLLGVYEDQPFGRSASGGEGPVMRYSSKPVEPESGLQNFGYRFYSPQLGRWLSRDPMQERGGVNLYGYVGNSPVGSFDALGLWGSVPGFRVHQNVTESELDALSKYEIALINAAHVYIDQDQFQTARFSFMHAMRSPEDSVACGAQKTNNFIRNQLLFARAHLQEGDRVRALWRFGFALHTLQDSSSPSHAGFRVWSGHEELWEKALHVVQEGHPVQAWGTSLARDTRRAFGILMGSDPFPERFFGADGKPENE